ncbi:LPS biosynthesis protein [Tepiditoga spiralis]|uniref:LPS biosynthesis protein n=1 Tax=Tepiditoga spiralis TaxID=2108365 RepID=A0A7G1G6N0_9BACT|nr:WecB/TagA/CpsF family glycosyltransferase [Tepiditoga spiralis]BBE31835.1 LPS biosynthesis protein [Tepiditoga spiralis]
MIKKVNFNEIDIITGKNNDILEFILNQKTKEKIWITTLNALMYMEYLKKSDYNKAIKESTFSIPDGFGIVKLLKKYDIFTEKCSGIETMKEICKNSKDGIYLLGSKENNVNNAAKNLKKLFNTNIVGVHHGYFSINDEEKIISDINSSKAKFLFVGMGIPKQELFIMRNYEKLNIDFIMGVGGSIDVFAGKVKRAPAFFQKFGLEWLYRMICEPKRLKKFPDLVKFYLKIYMKK